VFDHQTEKTDGGARFGFGQSLDRCGLSSEYSQFT
jgi:hypothetical protein